MKENPQQYFVRDATGLTRDLSGRDALIGNLAVMGIGFVFLYAFFSSLLYPGVDLPVTVIVGLIPGVVISLVYYLFCVAMPRTGGDFVWISRLIHPSLGFMANFYFTFTQLTLIGSAAVFVTVDGLAPLFSALGIIYSNQGFINIAGTLSSSPDDFVISIVVLLLCIVPLFFRAKVTYRVLLVIFLATVVGSLVTIGAFFSAPQGVFASNLAKLSSVSYTNTISLAGIPKGFNLSMTLTGIVYTMLSFGGYNFSAYYTGEIKQVKRSQLLGMLGSLGVFAVFVLLVYVSAYYSIGSDFLNAASFLAGTGSVHYTLPAPPILNFLVVFASPNPIVVFLSALAFIATCLGAIIVATFIAVRNFFAWSFDRIMPSWLVRVDSKRNTPYLAVIVALGCTIVFAALYIYTIFFQFVAYSVTNVYITFGIASIAAILFPMRRKDIFRSSPSIVQKRFGGVPIVSILGTAGLVLSGFLIYSSVRPAVTPPPSGSALIDTLAYAVVPLTGIVALAIYTLAYYYRKSQGIDMSLAFKQIPPE